MVAQAPRAFSDNGPNGKPKVLIDETFVEMVDRKGVYYEPVSNPPPGAITFTKAVSSRPIRAGLYRQGAYCPLVFRPRPEAVVAERAEYAAWRMGLEILAGELEGRLSAIAVLTPAAAWRPWAGQGEMHGRCRSCSAASGMSRIGASHASKKRQGGGRRCGGGLNHARNRRGRCVRRRTPA